jgi:hypothetical protein
MEIIKVEKLKVMFYWSKEKVKRDKDLHVLQT